MSKMFRHKNIFNLLFAVLLALPLINIAVRCIYVQSNKNAKDSYYGETINEENDVLINDISNLKIGKQYNLFSTNANFASSAIGSNGQRIYFDNFNVLATSLTDDLSNCTSIGFYKTNTSIYIYYYFFDNENNQIASFNTNVNYIHCTFTYLSNNLNTTNNVLYHSNCLYEITYNNYSYLDNAFEYSVNQFIEDNNFGNINFFEWFISMFFINNHKATTYVQFANWYMNYALLISLAYILFLVLMWFINFVRKLLDKGMSFGEGSY